MNPNSRAFKLAVKNSWLVWPASYLLFAVCRLIGFTDYEWELLLVTSFFAMIGVIAILFCLTVTRSVSELLGLAEVSPSEEQIREWLDSWYASRAYAADNYDALEPSDEDWLRAEAHFAARALELRRRENRLLLGVSLAVLSLVLVGFVFR